MHDEVSIIHKVFRWVGSIADITNQTMITKCQRHHDSKHEVLCMHKGSTDKQLTTVHTQEHLHLPEVPYHQRDLLHMQTRKSSNTTVHQYWMAVATLRELEKFRKSTTQNVERIFLSHQQVVPSSLDSWSNPEQDRPSGQSPCRWLSSKMAPGPSLQQLMCRTHAVLPEQHNESFPEPKKTISLSFRITYLLTLKESHIVMSNIGT